MFSLLNDISDPFPFLSHLSSTFLFSPSLSLSLFSPPSISVFIYLRKGEMTRSKGSKLLRTSCFSISFNTDPPCIPPLPPLLFPPSFRSFSDSSSFINDVFIHSTVSLRSSDSFSLSLHSSNHSFIPSSVLSSNAIFQRLIFFFFSAFIPSYLSLQSFYLYQFFSIAFFYLHIPSHLLPSLFFTGHLEKLQFHGSLCSLFHSSIEYVVTVQCIKWVIREKSPSP